LGVPIKIDNENTMAHHGQQLIIRWTRQSKTAPRSFLISSESNRTIKDFFKFIISIHRGLTGIIKDIFLENKRDKGAHVFFLFEYIRRDGITAEQCTGVYILCIKCLLYFPCFYFWIEIGWGTNDLYAPMW
jgi:hypothetical protein